MLSKLPCARLVSAPLTKMWRMWFRRRPNNSTAMPWREYSCTRSSSTPSMETRSSLTGRPAPRTYRITSSHLAMSSSSMCSFQQARVNPRSMRLDAPFLSANLTKCTTWKWRAHAPSSWRSTKDSLRCLSQSEPWRTRLLPRLVSVSASTTTCLHPTQFSQRKLANLLLSSRARSWCSRVAPLSSQEMSHLTRQDTRASAQYRMRDWRQSLQRTSGKRRSLRRTPPEREGSRERQTKELQHLNEHECRQYWLAK